MQLFAWALPTPTPSFLYSLFAPVAYYTLHDLITDLIQTWTHLPCAYSCTHVCPTLSTVKVLTKFLCTCTVCHPVVPWQDGSNALHLAAQGGHLQVIQFLSPRFGNKVYDSCDDEYTMLHWAAQMGHSQVARYLIKQLKMDPQDRDKVCGAPGEDVFQSIRSACIMHVCTRVALRSETWQRCVTGTCLYTYICIMLYAWKQRTVLCYASKTYLLFANRLLFGSGSPISVLTSLTTGLKASCSRTLYGCLSFLHGTFSLRMWVIPNVHNMAFLRAKFYRCICLIFYSKSYLMKTRVAWIQSYILLYTTLLCTELSNNIHVVRGRPVSMTLLE